MFVKSFLVFLIGYIYFMGELIYIYLLDILFGFLG